MKPKKKRLVVTSSFALVLIFLFVIVFSKFSLTGHVVDEEKTLFAKTNSQDENPKPPQNVDKGKTKEEVLLDDLDKTIEEYTLLLEKSVKTYEEIEGDIKELENTYNELQEKELQTQNVKGKLEELKKGIAEQKKFRENIIKNNGSSYWFYSLLILANVFGWTAFYVYSSKSNEITNKIPNLFAQKEKKHRYLDLTA